MARMAFLFQAAAGKSEICLGVGWGSGGLAKTAVFSTTTVDRRGIVAGNSARPFHAAMPGLITPADMPKSTPAEAGANEQKIKRCEEHARVY